MHRRNTYGVTAYFMHILCIFYAHLCIFKFAYNGIFISVHIPAYFVLHIYANFEYAYYGIFTLMHIQAYNIYICILNAYLCIF